VITQSFGLKTFIFHGLLGSNGTRFQMKTLKVLGFSQSQVRKLQKEHPSCWEHSWYATDVLVVVLLLLLLFWVGKW